MEGVSLRIKSEGNPQTLPNTSKDETFENDMIQTRDPDRCIKSNF